jgi:hypothetical protein
VRDIVFAAAKDNNLDVLQLYVGDNVQSLSDWCFRDPKTGEPHTSHTTNPVPCIVIHESLRPSLRSGGGLADIAPTVLDLMELLQPESMTGQTLISSR